MLVPQKCEKCGRPATYRFVRFVNGKPQDHFLCEDHASETSNWVPKPNASPEAIKAWLQGIVEHSGESGLAAPKVPDIRCRACGLPFEAYRRTLLLGCAECYRSFEQQLIPELRKFHGEVNHRGRTSGVQPEPGAFEAQADAPEQPEAPLPAEPVEPEEPADEAGAQAEEPAPPAASAPPDSPKPAEPAGPSAEELRRRLKEAVAEEDFEEAARLRDQLRKLERK